VGLLNVSLRIVYLILNISSTHGANIIEEVNATYPFPEGSVRAGEDNVITVVQDNMGKDMTVWTNNVPNADSAKSPRGIRGFKLNGGVGEFGDWKVQGKTGGYTGLALLFLAFIIEFLTRICHRYPDKHRGIYNEGGLFGERAGWHLPGYDTSSWNTVSNLSVADAGIRFFVATFDLDLPTPGNDILLSFNFEESIDQPYRSYFFVNGWMMGKRIGNLG
jgi:hypothetical protein